jgi:hypothetical protein
LVLEYIDCLKKKKAVGVIEDPKNDYRSKELKAALGNDDDDDHGDDDDDDFFDLPQKTSRTRNTVVQKPNWKPFSNQKQRQN